jgi:gas vesicle protein
VSKTEMKKATGFLLVGAAVGAGIALLYAPQSGSQTKKDIRRFARKTVDGLDELQTGIRDQVTDWVADVTEGVKDRLDRGKKFGTEACDRVLESFDRVRDSVDEGKARVEVMLNKETA